MRDMDRMMGQFGPMGGFGFGSPFGSPFGMLEGPPHRRERNGSGERGMVPRERHRDPFQSIFENMNSMMSQMHRSFVSSFLCSLFCFYDLADSYWKCVEQSILIQS